jgi:hypothetical protein
MEEVKPQSAIYRKFEMGKKYQLEILFDNPFPSEKVFNGIVKMSWKFTFLDLISGEKFFTFVGQNTKVAEKLLAYKKGDRIDLMLQSFEKNGQIMKSYKVFPFGEMPISYGGSSITPQQIAQTPSQYQFKAQAQAPEANSDIDVTPEMDW